MVIRIKQQNNKPTGGQAPSPKPKTKFTIQDVDNLFDQAKNWNKFYKQNESKLWESNVDIYQWPVYPLCTKEDQFYRCILHPQEEINNGSSKPLTVFFRNIHYAEFISHCIYYRPEEHKQYILEKLFHSHNDSS